MPHHSCTVTKSSKSSHKSKMALKKPDGVSALVKDPSFFVHKRLEPTKNSTGFMFLDIHPSVNPWLKSLPQSQNPLLDLGAAYGVHTIHAMKHGRDVVALDADKRHIEILQRRATDFQKSKDSPSRCGRLVKTVSATLPSRDVFRENSFSGILISEVLHFLRLGEPQKVLRDAYKWLQPGGTLVATLASALNMALEGYETGFVINGGMTRAQALKVIKEEPDNIAAIAPGYLEFPPGSPYRSMMGERMYLLTAKELGGFARAAGFEILELRTFSPKKYPMATDKTKNDCLLLVARKPL